MTADTTSPETIQPQANRPPPAPIRFRRATEADRTTVETLQQAAYDRERLLGLEPPPLKADYAEIVATMEVWLAEERAVVRGVLILDVRPDDLVIWSVAAAMDARGQGLGQIMLDAAEVRAEQLGRRIIRLDTGAVQQTLIGWYGRHGYEIEGRATVADHPVIHMIKRLASPKPKGGA